MTRPSGRSDGHGSPLTFAELFAGAGGLSMGLERAGWECGLHVEIDANARAILRAHWPGVPLLSDVVAISGGRKMKRWLRERYAGRFDLLSGGSPCQDLSVAGKRAGLAGARSSLFYRQMRLWRLLDIDLCLWEKVDGARSRNAGKDFGEVLRAFVGAAVPVPSDGWRSAGVAAGPAGVAAWRVLDAQYFGVPQRRRRIFVLGTRTGRVDPAEVLSLAEGVRGDSASRREARERVAADARESVAFALRGRDDGSRVEISGGITNSLRGASGGSSRDMVFDSLNNSAGEVAHTLRTNLDRGSAYGGVLAFDHAAGGCEPMTVTDELSPPIRSANSRQPTVLAFNTKQDGADADDIAPSLLAMPHDESHANGGGQVGVVVVPIQEVGKRTGISTTDPRAGIGIGNDGDPMYTLQAGAQHGVVAFGGNRTGGPLDVATGLNAHGQRQDFASETILVADAESVVGTLDARTNGGGFPGSDGAMQGHVQATAGVPRRLMPVECERLMSWPDNHTLVPGQNGKPLSDAARYKAIGNGVASVHTHWIGWRLALALRGEL
jgi:DNA (cytosine-5)-methyltransferase 1